MLQPEKYLTTGRKNVFSIDKSKLRKELVKRLARAKSKLKKTISQDEILMRNFHKKVLKFAKSLVVYFQTRESMDRFIKRNVNRWYGFHSIDWPQEPKCRKSEIERQINLWESKLRHLDAMVDKPLRMSPPVYEEYLKE